MDESLLAQNRRHRRSNVMLKATLEVPGDSLSIVLRNLSKDGALVKGNALPAAGTRVLFHRQGLSVPGTVAWSHAGHAGLEFDFELFPKEMLRHVPMADPRPAPEISRRPGLGPRPLTAGERSLIELWAVGGTPICD